jgi:dihydroorotate dehydrogenase
MELADEKGNLSRLSVGTSAHFGGRFLYQFAKSFLFRLSPERAHHVTIALLSKFPRAASILSKDLPFTPRLAQKLWDLPFPHPVGLAAGLDKNGVAIDGFLMCGFSFVEVGTITPKPQEGNPLPRLFRLLQDGALINRMGFNNYGSKALATAVVQHQEEGIIGINLGKNKSTPNEEAVSDYLTCLEDVFDVADYFVLNVSSPNTPGLRDLQSEASLVPLVKTLLAARNQLYAERSHRNSSARPCPPVLLKLAPDLSDESILTIGHALKLVGIDGFIASNTTLSRDGLASPHQREVGGLSGRPLRTRSTEVIRLLYEATGGTIPIIGSGGIFNAWDAYEKIRAGASLIQIYTGFIYQGPALIQDIHSGLNELLQQDGYASITDAIGIDVLLHK